MSRYIDAEALNGEVERKIFFIEKGAATNTLSGMMLKTLLEILQDTIQSSKTADVQEVKHGKWVHLGGDEWLCSECGFVITTEGSWEEPDEKYCTECGARMDLK